jgi:hypothetical protein
MTAWVCHQGLLFAEEHAIDDSKLLPLSVLFR